jgi:F0F1-type ATP synthase membrane subunit b/b'
LLAPALLTVEQLQQELINVRQQRDQARWEASNWRQRYEMEAQQRRSESEQAEQAIANLKTQLQPLATATLDPTVLASLQTQVAAETDSIALQALLLTALTEQERLRQGLQAEQASHAKTRHSLTNALGDAIDVFSRRRKRQSKPASL